ncbi:MAG: sugar phosphorylase [Verrucomicrobia bacterium]|nr:sugar phosphorylase [Verrucomicrobiota bacterium]
MARHRAEPKAPLGRVRSTASDNQQGVLNVGGASAPRPKQDVAEDSRGAEAPPTFSVSRDRPRLPLTEGDALLITYADQVREPGVAPLQTLAAVAEQYLTGVVSGIHLLPFYPWSSDDGFSVKDYFAVEPSCGSWEDIARLGGRFDLMFDAVFNHMSAQGEWFRRFLAGDPAYRNFFITVEGDPDLSRVIRPRALPLLTEFQTAAGPRKVWTTFSADQVDLSFKNPAVLLRALEALLFYVAKGARFIRLDAIAFLWKEIGTTCLHLPQTHQIIQLMRAVLDEVAPHVLLITETNVPHADNLSYFGDGANEAQLIYNFALPPLVLHAMATGNAEKLTRWARSLALPSDRVTFFNFLASHDGIGLNPARGILSDAEIDGLVALTFKHGGFVSHKNLPDGSQAPYELNINYLDALSAGTTPLEPSDETPHPGPLPSPARGEGNPPRAHPLASNGLPHHPATSFSLSPRQWGEGRGEGPGQLHRSNSDPAAGEPAELAARKFLTAQAMMLSLQGVPGIYFHSLFGSRGDRAGAEANGIKRRINREKLDRARLEAELADASSLRAQVFSGYRELLRVRAAHAAFSPAAAQRVLDLDPRLFVVLRENTDGKSRMLCLHNISSDTACAHVPGLLTAEVELPPYAYCWLSLGEDGPGISRAPSPTP